MIIVMTIIIGDACTINLLWERIVEDSRNINDTSRVVRMMIISDATIWRLLTDDSSHHFQL